MRKKTRKKTILKILLALSLAGVVGLSYLSEILERSPTTSCYTPYGFIHASSPKYYTSPEKIIIQPWRGQHHVYAIFQIPEGYQNEYLFTLNLPKEKTHCGNIMPIEENSIPGFPTKPKYYLIKGYLNTRVALTLIFQGKSDQLNQAQYWQLGYVKNNT